MTSFVSHPLFRGVLFLSLLVLALSFPLSAANQVDVHPGWNTFDGDTIFGFCRDVTFEVSIENDFIIKGMSLGFKIWTYGGIGWQWVDAGGYGSLGAVTDVSWSRFYPPDDAFDMTGFSITEFDVDGNSPDIIMAGGVAMFNGIPTGPLEHMFSLHLMPMGGDIYEEYTICIDSVFVPPSGAFVFVDEYGAAHSPTTLWPNGGRCWPLVWPRCGEPPAWDPGLPTQLPPIDGCVEEGVTLSASGLSTETFTFGHLDISGGEGSVIIDNHGDGTCEVFYIPASGETNALVTIPMTVANFCYGYPCIPAHTLMVFVESYGGVSIDCGSEYAHGATNNPIVKSDITGSGEFSLASGPGTIDPVTGYYEWIPGPADVGLFPVEVEATDGISTVTGSFSVDVVDEACCPGDANFTGSTDVRDAVFLINYVFKGGRAPNVPNWADVNADCAINVGDVVYLIAYIFTSGSAPILGCVY